MKSCFFLLLKIADCLLDFLRIVEIGAQLNMLDVAKALLQFNAQNYLDLLWSSEFLQSGFGHRCLERWSVGNKLLVESESWICLPKIL